MPEEAAAAALVRRLLERDRAAVATALNLLDDQRPAQREQALALLAALELATSEAERGGGALRVGLTGAPGAGKSTLLDALVRALRAEGATVGVLAVDPSSSRTGGALLGDRFRMRASARDEGVFLRSMAARSRLGGLADATFASALVLATVFDWVFVETVGVGQSEGDVARQVDTTIFVAQPGAGDLLQFMKAGVLELPDVFVVNKADTGSSASRTQRELRAGLGLGERKDAAWSPPVLLASARDASGIEEILDAVRAHRTFLERTDALPRARAEARVAWVVDALEARFGSHGIERLGGRAELDARARARIADGKSVFALLGEIAGSLEAKLDAGLAPR